ncbi:MAG: hypothetical protein J6J24_03315 [Clostridia bacterium]|nr:hypothetical protein [Clostridia bacterium]
MKEIKIDANLDVIDYIAENPDLCKGRRIFIDKDMFDKVLSLTDNITSTQTCTTLKIVCPETGNLTTVFLANYNTLTQVVDVIADDIEPIGKIDSSKEALLIVNEKVKKTSDERIK